MEVVGGAPVTSTLGLDFLHSALFCMFDLKDGGCSSSLLSKRTSKDSSGLLFAGVSRKCSTFELKFNP